VAAHNSTVRLAIHQGPPHKKGRKVVTKEQTKKETFQLIEPNAEEVLLVGDFTDWEENPILLKREKDGLWKVTVPLQPGEHEYRFRVDGEWRNDVKCAGRKPNPYGGENCVRTVAP
jgi:1,4-alpha-glucan branching enzyme